MRHFAGITVSLLVTAGLAGCVLEAGDFENVGKSSEEIKGGTVVTTDTWGSPFWGCSSILLRDRWLLTAKHCLPSAGVPVSLVNGQSATFQDPIYPHPTLDVTIVRLSSALTPSGSTNTRGPYPLYKGSEAQLLNKTIICQADGPYDCPADGGACTGFGTLNSSNFLVSTVSTGLPGFCNGDPGCFRTTPQKTIGGDSGGGCALLGTPVQRNRIVGTISGTSQTENFHVSAPRFRDWANGIIGTAPTLGALTGYERSDLTHTVLYVNPSNHVIELAASTAGWSRADLTTHVGTVNSSSNPAATVRWDGTNSVVFRSSDHHIRELSLPHGGNWSARDLTQVLGAPLGAVSTSPTTYSRSDRVGVVLYRSNTNHVIEISRDGDGDWCCVNALDTLFGTPLAASDPIGYVRSDGSNGVVYRDANGHIWELALPMGGFWVGKNLTLEAGAPIAIGQPRPYTRPDGVTAVVYRSINDNRVRELRLTATGWQHSALNSSTAPRAVTDPFGYVRADGRAAVVYKSSDNRIRETTLSGGSWTFPENLTPTGVPLASGTGLSAFVRSDLISQVIYRTSDNHVHGLQRTRGGTSWVHVDLTNATGGAI